MRTILIILFSLIFISCESIDKNEVIHSPLEKINIKLHDPIKIDSIYNAGFEEWTTYASIVISDSDEKLIKDKFEEKTTASIKVVGSTYYYETSFIYDSFEDGSPLDWDDLLIQLDTLTNNLIIKVHSE